MIISITVTSILVLNIFANKYYNNIDFINILANKYYGNIFNVIRICIADC